MPHHSEDMVKMEKTRAKKDLANAKKDLANVKKRIKKAEKRKSVVSLDTDRTAMNRF